MVACGFVFERKNWIMKQLELDLILPPTALRTFDHWRQVPESFATTTQWLKRGRKVQPNEKPTARWISTVEAAPGDCGEIWLDDPDLFLLVETEIPLYHIDQTKPVNLTARSVAYLGFEEIFYEAVRKDRHILRNEDWMTIKARPGADFFWAMCLLTRQTVRQHVNGSKIIGVMATDKTRFVAIDHDFHGNDPTVFLEQAAVLLNHFHGWGTWHHQVKVGQITGMHHILTFDQPKNLKKVIAVVRKRLIQLDQQHPDLAARAKAAGMPTFSKMEVFPQPNKGFRLPLCQGYQMLLDRPLPMVEVRGQMVQDVVGYVNWLNDPSRSYMPKAEILALLSCNLGAGKEKIKDQPMVTKQQAAKKTTNKQQPSEIGSLKGCCRQKTVGFWLGTFHPPGSLNKFIVVSARILFFEGVAEEDAVELLKKYVRDIPDDARDCSSRLLAEDWAAIDANIVDDVAAAYNGNSGQEDIEVSTDKLRMSVACWRKIGFKLSDKTTWGHSRRRPKGNLRVVWSDEDRKNIRCYLGPALGKKHAHLACEVAEGIVKLVARQHASENGMDYGYWAAFLNDQYGIACGNRNKVARIIRACEALGLVEVHCRAIWGQRRGFATVYRPGGLARNRNKEERKAPIY